MQRLELEGHVKNLEAQLLDLRLKTDEQGRQVQDMSLSKSRLQADGSEFARQVEELQVQIVAASAQKAHSLGQLVKIDTLKDFLFEIIVLDVIELYIA